MWQGANPSGQPPVIRPSNKWHILSGISFLLALTQFVAVVLLNLTGMKAGDDPQESGSAADGVRVALVANHHYFIYVEQAANVPSACALASSNGSSQLTLNRKNSWSATDTLSDSGRDYRYAATFKAPRDETAIVTCDSQEGTILIKPDDTAFGYLGISFIVGGILSAIGFSVSLIVLLRRSGSKRAAQRRAMAPPRPTYWTD